MAAAFVWSGEWCAIVACVWYYSNAAVGVSMVCEKDVFVLVCTVLVVYYLVASAGCSLASAALTVFTISWRFLRTTKHAVAGCRGEKRREKRRGRPRLLSWSNLFCSRLDDYFVVFSVDSVRKKNAKNCCLGLATGRPRPRC